MIQPRGVGLVLVAIVLFVLARATDVGWLFLFDAVLWGTLVVSAVIPWLAIGRLEVQRKVAGWEGADREHGPTEGDAVTFAITVTNRSLLPSVFTTIRYELQAPAVHPHTERLFIAWLGGRRALHTTTSVRFPRRGHYALPPMTSRTSAPFGLFGRTRRASADMRVLVLPRVFPVNRAAVLDSGGDLLPRPRSARVGEQISGSRTYVRGDPWHHIHWRNTARVGYPQLKEFEQSAECLLIVALDALGARRQSAEALDHAIRIAASAGDAVFGAGGAVRLLTEGAEETFNSRYPLLKRLALIEGHVGTDLSTLLRDLPPTANILVVVPGTDSAETGTLSRLTAGGYRANVVILRGFGQAEHSTPPDVSYGPGLPVVECWPGGVPAALASLERASLPAGGPEAMETRGLAKRRASARP